MPRFYFNVHDGVNKLDKKGTVLPDRQAARIEAVRLAGDILKHEAHRVGLYEDWRIEVTDQTGVILFQMTFQAVEAPVLLEQTVRDQNNAR